MSVPAVAESRDIRSTLDRDGFVVLRDVLDSTRCDRLQAMLAGPSVAGTSRRGGVRGLLQKVPGLIEWIDESALRPLIDAALSPAARPVRGILFDKTEEANWLVPWHQDLTIAVTERRDHQPGYGPWSVKEGVVHVQPPPQILDRVVTLRVHLDDCAARNGALRVLPGSHRRGIAERRPEIAPVTCELKRGGVLLMRPLLWHSSLKATRPSHRRVFHVECSDAVLPEGVHWNRF